MSDRLSYLSKLRSQICAVPCNSRSLSLVNLTFVVYHISKIKVPTHFRDAAFQVLLKVLEVNEPDNPNGLLKQSKYFF